MRTQAAVLLASVLFTASSVSAQPFIQQGSKLVGTGATPSRIGFVEQGFAVAISADGNTALVGGPLDANKGAVWVYTRTNGVWSQQGPKLVGSDLGTSGTTDGSSVALSADGNTAVIGAAFDTFRMGAARIFTRSGGVWTEQAKLVGTGGVGTHQSQGTSVAISADGNTVIVGGPGSANEGSGGGAWIFTRSGSTWTQQGSMLVGTGAVGAAGQGKSVGLSADGNTALVGGPADNGGAGAVWVFTRSGGTWSQQGSKLLGSGATGLAEFGSSVAVAGNGQTAAIGGPSDNGGFNGAVGAVWVFTRSGSSWSQQGSKLVGPGSSGPMVNQGGSVSLSGNGDVLLEGGRNDGFDFANGGAPGASWAFIRAGGVWTPLGAKLVGTGAAGKASQGASVSLSSDGATAIVGGPLDSPSGAAWIFTRPGDLLRASDHDGDGRSEITIYNTTSGQWSSLTSSSGFTAAINGSWGGLSYTAVPGDYDGDGRTDLGAYQSSTGNWYVLLSSTGFTGVLSKTAGGPGWQAVPRDFDGDGRTDIVVYNTTTGQWWGFTSSTNYASGINVNWGGTDYVPVAADYDGDRKADLGVYNTTTGLWAVLLSSSNYTTTLGQYCGGSGWSPVPADFDGDGKTDVVVYNASPGHWYGLLSGGNYTTTLNMMWGGSTYQPVKGDFDGDGRADLATYVNDTGMWYILLSGANYTTAMTRAFGGPGYAAVPQYP